MERPLCRFVGKVRSIVYAVAKGHALQGCCSGVLWIWCLYGIPALGFTQALEVLDPNLYPQPLEAAEATGAGASLLQPQLNGTVVSGSSHATVKYVSVKLQQLQEEHLSPAQAAAVVHGGSKGLQQQLEDEHEASLPEFLRKRPKVRPELTFLRGMGQMHSWEA
jgi:hypothetical protein